MFYQLCDMNRKGEDMVALAPLLGWQMSIFGHTNQKGASWGKGIYIFFWEASISIPGLLSTPCQLSPLSNAWNIIWINVCYDYQVSVEECENMAKQLKTPFIECSAKNRMNVDQAFFELVRLIRRFQALERPVTAQKEKEKSKSKCLIF